MAIGKKHMLTATKNHSIHVARIPTIKNPRSRNPETLPSFWGISTPKHRILTRVGVNTRRILVERLAVEASTKSSHTFRRKGAHAGIH